MSFDRITVDSAQMGGAPCIRGMRSPVATVVGLVTQGLSNDKILEEYSDLEPESIKAALRYAAASVTDGHSRFLIATLYHRDVSDDG
jgi:uncharacterized protein (DUF433 family)